MENGNGIRNAYCIIILCFAFLFWEVEGSETIFKSYTNGSSPRLCITKCGQFNENPHFTCINENEIREGCSPGTEPLPQYYASLGRECQSICGPFGPLYHLGIHGNHNWCYVSPNNKEECSRHSGFSTTGNRCQSNCKFLGSGYGSCIIRTYPLTSEQCTNSPNYREVNEYATTQLLSNKGEYTVDNEFQKCDSRSEEVGAQNVGVVALLAYFKSIYQVQYRLSPLTNADDPVEYYVTSPAPPRPGLDNVDLVYGIFAIFRPNHLGHQRSAILGSVSRRMANMQRDGGDESGQLVPASLGGTNNDFNFAPQTPIINRASGGDSYMTRIEDDIVKALRQPNFVRVDWSLVVSYGDLMVSRRPTGFGIEYKMYANNGTQITENGPMFFDNASTGGACM